jgi:hypothetical protein
LESSADNSDLCHLFHPQCFDKSATGMTAPSIAGN